MKRILACLVGLACVAGAWAADTAPTGFWTIARADIRGLPAADAKEVQAAEDAMRKMLSSAPGTASTNAGGCLYLQPRASELVFFVTVLREPTGVAARLETLRAGSCQMVGYQVLHADTFADLFQKTGTAIAGSSTDNLPPAPDPAKSTAAGVSFKPGYEEQNIPDDLKRKVGGLVDQLIAGLLAERVPVADRMHLKDMLQVKNPWAAPAGPTRRVGILNTAVIVMINAVPEPPGVQLRAINAQTGGDILKVVPLNNPTGVKDAISTIRGAFEQAVAKKAPEKP